MQGRPWMVIVLILSLAGGVGLARLSGGELGTQQPGPVIQGSDTWVPFSADMRRVSPNGATTVGRFYQASDGSTRSESGPENGSVNVIGIKNIHDATFFMWHERSGWESHPMEIPSQRWLPKRQKTIDLSMDTLGERIDGFDVIKTVEPSGFTVYRAVQLNFFAIQIAMCPQKAASACGVIYPNVIVGEVPQELFKPPSGENIVHKTDPAGIVQRAPRQ